MTTHLGVGFVGVGEHSHSYGVCTGIPLDLAHLTGDHVHSLAVVFTMGHTSGCNAGTLFFMFSTEVKPKASHI